LDKEPARVNLPNFLTLCRILLVPVILMALVRGGYGTAMWLFLAAGVTDALDGFIARRFGLVTRLGSFLDPLADKLLVVTSVIVLAVLGKLPWWLAAVIVTRDLLILGGACSWYKKTGDLQMEPTMLSKVNTVLQIALIYLVLAQGAGLARVDSWLNPMFGLALCTTVVSGMHYVVVWGRRAREL